MFSMLQSIMYLQFAHWNLLPAVIADSNASVFSINIGHGCLLPQFLQSKETDLIFATFVTSVYGRTIFFVRCLWELFATFGSGGIANILRSTSSALGDFGLGCSCFMTGE